MDSDLKSKLCRLTSTERLDSSSYLSRCRLDSNLASLMTTSVTCVMHAAAHRKGKLASASSGFSSLKTGGCKMRQEDSQWNCDI